MGEDYWERRRREQEEDRKHQERQRKYEIDSLRRYSRIRELDREIESRRRQLERDEAARKIRAEWSDAREAIEKCTAVPPELRRQWLENFDAIEWYRDGARDRIELLREAVEGVSGRLATISAGLRKAASRRDLGPLFHLFQPLPELRVQPWDRTSMLRERNPLLLHTDHFGFGAAPEPDRLAEDLRPIREQIRSAPGVFTEQRSGWLDQLQHIDDSKSTSAAAAGRLADEVDRHAESVRMGVVLVTASLTLLCSYCYTYHNP